MFVSYALKISYLDFTFNTSEFILWPNLSEFICNLSTLWWIIHLPIIHGCVVCLLFYFDKTILQDQKNEGFLMKGQFIQKLSSTILRMNVLEFIHDMVKRVKCFYRRPLLTINIYKTFIRHSFTRSHILLPWVSWKLISYDMRNLS